MMVDIDDLSQAKMVLLAIYRVSKSFGNRVPFEEIVLQAWKDFPEQFSLRNHPEFPIPIGFTIEYIQHL